LEKIDRFAIIIKAYDPRMIGKKIHLTSYEKERGYFDFVFVEEADQKLFPSQEMPTVAKRCNFEYCDLQGKLDKILE